MHQTEGGATHLPPYLEVEFGVSIAIGISVGDGQGEVSLHLIWHITLRRIPRGDYTGLMPHGPKPMHVVFHRQRHPIDDGGKAVVENSYPLIMGVDVVHSQWFLFLHLSLCHLAQDLKHTLAESYTIA